MSGKESPVPDPDTHVPPCILTHASTHTPIYHTHVHVDTRTHSDDPPGIECLVDIVPKNFSVVNWGREGVGLRSSKEVRVGSGDGDR